MYDIIVVGSGIAGSTFAAKISKFAKTLIIEAREKDQIPKTTNVFPLHNRPFIQEVDWEDKQIFPNLHMKTNYKGYNVDGIINTEEFGAPLGNMTYLEELIKKFLQICEDQGCTVKNGERVNKISRKNNCIEVYTSEGKLYQSKVLVISTGSHSFELQKSLGFEAPRSYTGVFTHLYGNE